MSGKLPSPASIKVAYSFTSACASAAIRLYYTVILSHSSDVTYYTSVMGLWTIPEMASGILALCLPVSPRFFQSLKESKHLSGVRSSLRSFLQLSRTDRSWPSDNLSGRNERKKFWKGSDTTEETSRMYSVLPEGHELVSKSGNASSESNTREQVPDAVFRNQKEDPRIIRSIHIATTDDFSDASMKRGGNGAGIPWYGQC